jgi:hypothetical protein
MSHLTFGLPMSVCIVGVLVFVMAEENDRWDC